MDKIALNKTLQRMPEVTFPVLVEGEVLHFPIHHRHAPVGTVHTWGDGHKYRKTASGWELVHEPGSGDAPGEPQGSADLSKVTTARAPETPAEHRFYDQAKKYIDGTGKFPSADGISNARAIELANHAKNTLAAEIAAPKAEPVPASDGNLTVDQLRQYVKNPGYRDRTEKALADAQAELAKEMKYSADLRKPERVKELEAHIAKLKAVLAPDAPVAQAAEPGKSRIEFRNGLHTVIDPSGRAVASFTTAKAASDWLHKPLPDWKPSDMDKAKAKPWAHVPLPPDQALTAGTAAAEKKPVEKPRELFDMIGHTKWETSVKPGDEVEVRWTNSHNYYRARARVIANNDASMRVSLLSSIGSVYRPGTDDYSVGREIVVPKSFNLSGRMRSFGSSKWSQNNGVFPVSDKTKPADTAKIAAHAEVMKNNGSAKDYARGDRILVHHPAKTDKYDSGPDGTIEYEVEKSLYKNNMLAVRPITKDKGAYSTSINLASFPHRIEKKLDPKPELSPLPHPSAGAKLSPAATAMDAAEKRTMVVPRTASTADSMSHAVLDSGTNITMSYHGSPEEAKTAADQMQRYHGREFHVAELEAKKASDKGAHEPSADHETSYNSTGGSPVKHYDTKSVKRSLSTPAHHTHAVIDSDTGEVISTHGEGSAGVVAAAGGSARRHMSDMNQMGWPANGKRAHVDSLEPHTQAHTDAQQAHGKAQAAKHTPPEHDPDKNWIKSGAQLKPIVPEKPSHVSQEMHDAVVAFAHKVADTHAANAVRQGYTHKVHVHNLTPKVQYKRTYAYVDVGGSGKYMIPLVKPSGRMSHAEVGDIHGLDSAYGVPHPGKRYGNVLKGDAKVQHHGSF